MPTIRVPIRLYDAALTWCNKQRATKNLPPLKALPPGRPHSPSSCPCGDATGLQVCTDVAFEKGGDSPQMKLPHGVRSFIRFFDRNAPQDQLSTPIRGIWT